MYRVLFEVKNAIYPTLGVSIKYYDSRLPAYGTRSVY